MAKTIDKLDKSVQQTLDMSGYATASHGTHVTFTSTVPKVAGTAAVGSATTVSRSDHVHPPQTSVSGNAGSATKLATARTLTIGSTGKAFDGSANVSWTVAEIGAAASSHSHNVITSRGNVTCESGVTARPAVAGLSMSQAYNNGYPTTYGNVLNMRGTGDGQLLIGWSGTDGAHAPVYVRSKRDNTSTANWSGWAQIYTTAHKPTPSDIGAAASSHGTHVTYSTTSPKVAGTAATGSEGAVARGDHVHAAQTSVSGNAGSATKLATARNIVIGNKTNSFNGTANITFTLSDIGAAATSHTHNYAGSSSAGGVANSATKLATARTINGTTFDGSANITTANWGTARKINQISVNGSADVKLPLDYYTCSIGSSNAKPYHHILTTGQCTGSWTDKSITIVLVNHYNGAGLGIAKATLRTNDATNGATASGELRWLVRSGFAENALCFNIRNTAKDAYMDVFYKSGGAYAGLTWYVLTEGARGNHSSQWTKYSTNHDNGTNVYDETGMKAIRTYTATLQSATDHGDVNSAKTAATCSGNSKTATTLQTARTINGTSFNGSANITTANWGTSRTITIGSTGKAVNGSGNVSWTLSEIGAAAASHTHNYAGSSSAGGAANSANILNQSTKMDYGWSGLNYFNINGTAGNAAKVNDTPTSAWWHIIRCNHANSSGYYTDIAVPFNATSMYYKRITGGAVQNNGWVKILDALNWSDYAAAKSHGNHVPTTQTADARKFLRNDNSWQSLPTASTSATGIVQLNNTVTSTSTTQAATANAVKTAYDKANEAFQSGSNAKTKLVNALTAKGATASTSDSWDTLIGKIDGLGKFVTGSKTCTVQCDPAGNPNGTSVVEVTTNLGYTPTYLFVKIEIIYLDSVTRFYNTFVTNLEPTTLYFSSINATIKLGTISTNSFKIYFESASYTEAYLTNLTWYALK